MRTSNKLTRKQFASMLRTTQSVVSRLENDDTHSITIRTLEKIATALDSTLSIEFIPNKKRPQAKK